MALWDNLSKKASETTAKVVQQTKNFTESNKLSNMIADEEKRINQIYHYLGKQYATTHRNDPEPEFAEMIAAIIASEEKIAQYKLQIQDLKGVQRCEKCGTEVTKGSAFCNACGAPFPPAEQPVPAGQVQCPGCGKLMEKGVRFCTACGKPLEAAPAAQSALASQPAQRLCPNCGRVLAPDVLFCTECGTKIQE